MAQHEKRFKRLCRELNRRGIYHIGPNRAAGMVAAVFMLAVGHAYAGSNLPSAGYPDPQCGEQPEPPIRPDQFRFRAELDAYNKQVTAFNAAEKHYVACIRNYVQNAVSDIASIRKKIDGAVESTRR